MPARYKCPRAINARALLEAFSHLHATGRECLTCVETCVRACAKPGMRTYAPHSMRIRVRVFRRHVHGRMDQHSLSTGHVLECSGLVYGPCSRMFWTRLRAMFQNVLEMLRSKWDHRKAKPSATYAQPCTSDICAFQALKRSCAWYVVAHTRSSSACMCMRVGGERSCERQRDAPHGDRIGSLGCNQRSSRDVTTWRRIESPGSNQGSSAPG